MNQLITRFHFMNYLYMQRESVIVACFVGQIHIFDFNGQLLGCITTWKKKITNHCVVCSIGQDEMIVGEYVTHLSKRNKFSVETIVSVLTFSISNMHQCWFGQFWSGGITVNIITDVLKYVQITHTCNREKQAKLWSNLFLSNVYSFRVWFCNNLRYDQCVN